MLALTDDPEVNAAVAADAHTARIFCVRGDAAGGGTAVTPATAEVPAAAPTAGAVGPVQLAVLGGGWLEARYGIAPSLFSARSEELTLFAAIVAAGGIASLLPGYRAYRLSLSDGLNPRL